MRRSLLLRARGVFSRTQQVSYSAADSTQQGMVPLEVAAALAAGAASSSLRALPHIRGGPALGMRAASTSAGMFASQMQSRAALPRSVRADAASRSSAADGSPDGAESGSGRSSRSSRSSSDLRQLKGVGPVNEERLRQRQILALADLHRLYHGECKGDAEELARYLLSEVGIRRQHSDMIASAMQAWAEEQAGADEGITLSVEGNISAGKSTFLDILSHEQTQLSKLMEVVQEPVSQWQAVECRDRHGAKRTQNVLAKFYENPERYAYSFQHYVLISRMEQNRKTRANGKALRVLERSIFSDRQVFVRAMHASGTMEDFEVSVYNQIFDDHISQDLGLIPDGFVYLRASPDTCMQRLRKRSRSEEVGISEAYLEMLHANHEDWLQHGQSLKEFELNRPRDVGLMSVLSPAREGLAERFSAQGLLQPPSTEWKYELIKNVPEAIKDQVLLLKGEDDLPQLANRLALVMDHDRDVDIHGDEDARREYAAKIRAFYEFVQSWKARETAALGQQAQPGLNPELQKLAHAAASMALEAAYKRGDLRGYNPTVALRT